MVVRVTGPVTYLKVFAEAALGAGVGVVELFLDGPAQGSQMIAETQRWRPLALGKVAVKLQLTAQGDACPDPFGLASLGVADRLRNREEVPSGGGGHKKYAIVIAQDQVLPAHRPISYRGRRQRILGADIEALRAGGDCSQAEDRQPDRSNVGGVAMQPPDHESLQPSSLRLERHKIANAGFVESSAVVDHQYLARCRSFERLQEDIDAADMLSWTHTPS